MKAHFYPVSRSRTQLAALSSVVMLAWALSGPAHAVDGCKVLLCMAGNWKNISQCEPTVRQALRDVARGDGWPECSMGGNNQAANQYLDPAQCPEQYRTVVGYDDYSHPIYSCPFSGVINVDVEGQPWTRTWWSTSGDTVVEWLPAAKTAFANSPGSMDDRFDRDHAAWVISEQIRLAAEAAAANRSSSWGGF